MSRRAISGRAVAALAVGTLALAGCTSPGSGVTGFTEGDGSFTAIEVADREPAPVLTGDKLGGGTLTTQDFAGKVIVVNVWGSWCAPCRHEAPSLQQSSEATQDVAQFVGINTRDLSQDPALAFERSFGVTYPSFYDPSGTLLAGFPQLPPRAIPSTVIIDREGKVAARFLGETDQKTLVDAVNDVAEGK